MSAVEPRRRSMHDYLELLLGPKYSTSPPDDIQAKFATMALAFKTDRFTLAKRVDVHKHQRDLAESSVNTEIDILRNMLKVRGKDVSSLDYSDKVQAQMAVVKRATEKAISRAEMYGQVQQENKVFKALEIMINYVENLKRTYESEHAELEDTKRILMENNIVLDHDQVGVILDAHNSVSTQGSASPIGNGDASGGNSQTSGARGSSACDRNVPAKDCVHDSSAASTMNVNRGKTPANKSEHSSVSSLQPFFSANHQPPRRASIAGVTVLTHIRGQQLMGNGSSGAGGLSQHGTILSTSPSGKLRLLTPRNSSSNLYDIIPISNKASDLTLALRLAHAQALASANAYQRSASVRMGSYDEPRRMNEQDSSFNPPVSDSRGLLLAYSAMQSSLYKADASVGLSHA